MQGLFEKEIERNLQNQLSLYQRYMERAKVEADEINEYQALQEILKQKEALIKEIAELNQPIFSWQEETAKILNWPFFSWEKWCSFYPDHELTLLARDIKKVITTIIELEEENKAKAEKIYKGLENNLLHLQGGAQALKGYCPPSHHNESKFIDSKK